MDYDYIYTHADRQRNPGVLEIKCTFCTWQEYAYHDSLDIAKRYPSLYLAKMAALRRSITITITIKHKVKWL